MTNRKFCTNLLLFLFSLEDSCSFVPAVQRTPSEKNIAISRSRKRRLVTETPTESTTLFSTKEATPNIGLLGSLQDRNQRHLRKNEITILDHQISTEKKNSFSKMMNNRTDFEMAVMSTVAITVPMAVILILAGSSMDTQGPGLGEQTNAFFRDIFSSRASVEILAEEGVELLEDSIEELEAISLNVFDAAVPTTAVDVISIALGEGLAAAIGGVVTYFANIGVKSRGVLQQGLDTVGLENSTEASADYFIQGAVADTDYFITRAAATGLGLPPFLGVILATIPSQLIKLSARQREQRRKEDELLQAMLLEEQELKKKRPFRFGGMNKPKPINRNVEEMTAIATVTPGAANQIDGVEIFSDVTKWLEYDVLVNGYQGMITVNDIPISPGLESAIYGFLAALSSQLWADAIYRFSDFGSDANREAARSRSLRDTFTLYSLRCLSAFTLFGVYESARLPIALLISNLISGGVDGCLGSDDFQLCLDTYMLENPASATIEGQLRAFFVAAANSSQRFLLDFQLGDLSIEQVKRQFLQIYNMVNQ
ncbi:hypothetical protein CTEN210_14688 [Chaetoceros tenuissimus]|uniref:Uncharacterized protein n=1 Tax=Chaetoceros tenuissimus TaxID=426638 RepID=A0AAD3D5C0_9STRA|nr:hypothetical protein CTEN210_14688 [Chaetoceros tenuissimus]